MATTISGKTLFHIFLIVLYCILMIPIAYKFGIWTFWAGVFLIIIIFWVIPDLLKSRTSSGYYRDKINLTDIDKMDGVEFELFLQKLFQNMGYSVKLTPTSNDMGADLILSKPGERISVQAKNWKANVGNSAVQEVVGSLKFYKTQRGIVISSSDFSNQAITLAHHNQIELWNRDKLNDMINKYPIGK
jgi:restriction system protein